MNDILAATPRCVWPKISERASSFRWAKDISCESYSVLKITHHPINTSWVCICSLSNVNLNYNFLSKANCLPSLISFNIRLVRASFLSPLMKAEAGTLWLTRREWLALILSCFMSWSPGSCLLKKFDWKLIIGIEIIMFNATGQTQFWWLIRECLRSYFWGRESSACLKVKN